MKQYTDIEQSRRLAEILPKESADQTWEIIAIAGANLDVPEYWHSEIPCILNSKIGIPCWSLAALLEDVLPLEAEIHKQTDGHKMCYYVEAYIPPKGKRKAKYLSTVRYENLVDACVEMIFILKKKDLI